MFSRNKDKQQVLANSVGTGGTLMRATTSIGEDGQLHRSLPGHPGNLSPAQAEALHKFCEELNRQRLYVPPSSPGGRASHTDATLLRFLRARKFDVTKAIKQFTDAENWRRKHNVDELYSKFPPDEIESTKRFYPTWTGRRDRRGLPIFVSRLADLDSARQKELSTIPPERRYQRIIALYELMTRGILNLCSALAKDTPPEANNTTGVTSPLPSPQVTSVISLVDLSGVSLTQLWNVRSHLQQASSLATANYPETLNSIFVLNAPAFFPTVWNWFKGFFDLGTQEKIKVLGNPAKDPSTLDALTQYIAKENIPKAYGGELDWTTGDDPKFDEPIKQWLKENMDVEKIHGPIFIDPWRDATHGLVAKSDTGSSVGDSGVGMGSGLSVVGGPELDASPEHGGKGLSNPTPPANTTPVEAH